LARSYRCTWLAWLPATALSLQGTGMKYDLNNSARGLFQLLNTFPATQRKLYSKNLPHELIETTSHRHISSSLSVLILFSIYARACEIPSLRFNNNHACYMFTNPASSQFMHATCLLIQQVLSSCMLHDY
jgi:hypothetical protein